MAKTHRLDLFVKPTSTATEQQVFDYAIGWVNDRTNDPSNQDDGEPINAYYCDVTDFKRGGKKYMIFGDVAKDMLDLDQKMDILDPSIYATKTTVDGHEDRISVLEQTADETTAQVI